MMSGRPILAMASDTCASAPSCPIWSSSWKHLQTTSTCPALMRSVTMRASTSPRPRLRHNIDGVIRDSDYTYMLLLPKDIGCACRQAAGRGCQHSTLSWTCQIANRSRARDSVVTAPIASRGSPEKDLIMYFQVKVFRHQASEHLNLG